MIKGLKENKCEVCGCTESLELHHINGISSDLRLENLQILCPNCHSYTDNWRGKNINTGKVKIEEQDYVDALRNSPNIR